MGCMGSAPAEQATPETAMEEFVKIEFDREKQQDAKNEAKESLKKLYEFLIQLVDGDELKENIKDDLPGTWTGDQGKNTGCDSKYNGMGYDEVTKFAEVATFKNFPTASSKTYELLFALSYTSVFYGQIAIVKGKQVHSESGFLFFTWDYTLNKGEGGIGVMKGIVSERGINILAGGSIEILSATSFKVDLKADIDDQKYGIIQSPYVYFTTRSIGYEWKATFDLEAGTIDYVQSLTYMRLKDGKADPDAKEPITTHGHQNTLYKA